MSAAAVTELDHVGWPADIAARYRAAGYWRGQTFGALLSQVAAAYADRTAVVGETGSGIARWSFAEVDDQAHRLAAGFTARGIAATERVVVQLPNVMEFLPIVFGLWRAGIWPVFALPAHRHTELRHIASHSEAAAILTVQHHDRFNHTDLAHEVAAAVPTVRQVLTVGSAEFADLAATSPRELPDPDPESVAFLQLSGGSTGLPKLIPRTHDDYLYSVRESARICRLRPDSVYLAALPVAHNFPLSSPGVLGALHAGAASVFAPRPEPGAAFDLIESEGVTITGLVPPLAASWAHAATTTHRDLSSLEVVLVGGAKCGPELAARIGPALGCRLQQVFGMAEGLVNYTRLDDDDELILNTQGRPISDADEIRVVDPDDPAAGSDATVAPGSAGALLTRGPYTIRGYYRDPRANEAAFTSDGFYRTGDLVRRRESGHLEVVGRVTEQVNRGGEKVSPEEIEEHIVSHPGVWDVAVIAAPDDYLGERICAYVIPTEVGAVTGPQVRRHVRQQDVAVYKIPDLVHVVDVFPVTGVGKISKRELRVALASLSTVEGAR